MVGQATGDDQQGVLVDGDLGIVRLLKPSAAGTFHDARLRVGEIVLVFVLRLARGWCRWPSGRLASRALGFSLALAQLSFVLGLLGRLTFLRPGFEHFLG